MIKYKIIKGLNGVPTILNCFTNEYIPIDSDNIDFCEFAKWVAQGNIPGYNSEGNP